MKQQLLSTNHSFHNHSEIDTSVELSKKYYSSPSKRNFAKNIHIWSTYFPIEVWLVFIPSIIALIIVSWCFIKNGTADPQFVNGLLHSLIGVKFLEIAVKILYTYFVCRICYNLFHAINSKQEPENFLRNFLVLVRSILFYMILIALSAKAYSSTLSILFQNSDPGHILSASKELFSADISLFGIYPANYLNALVANFPRIQDWILASYLYLSWIVSGAFLILLFSNTHLFRKFFISFMLTSLLACLFWYMVPAISPRAYVDLNILHEARTPAFFEKFQATPATHIARYLPLTDKIWIDPDGLSFSVSTFPSMHAAWAIIVTASLMSLIPIADIVLIPWLILLSIGAIMIYQHYAVDVIFGLLLGAVIFKLVGLFLDKEKKYFIDRYQLLIVQDMLVRDGLKLKKILRLSKKN